MLLTPVKPVLLYVMRVEDDSGDKLVSVQLDDEESWLNFIDVPGSEVCLIHALYSIQSLVNVDAAVKLARQSLT